MLVFMKGGNRGTRREKTLPRTKDDEQSNKLNPHVMSGPGIEPGSQWWEAITLTTAPSKLPQEKKLLFNTFDHTCMLLR